MTASKIVAAAASGVGGGTTDVDDVFRVFTHVGNNSNSRTLVNNIDFSGEGGLFWIKCRSIGESHNLFDTDRGPTKVIIGNDNDAEDTVGSSVFGSFNNNGVTVGGHGRMNESPREYVSWSFRKAPKFFDIVTYTGNGSNRTIAHNLGCEPGMIVVKQRSGSGGWFTYHKFMNGGTNAAQYYARLDDAGNNQQDSSVWNNTGPSTTTFSVGTHNDLNQNGETYVAYLFAHNANDGEFGPDSDQDIIKCSTYDGNGSSNGPDVNVGFEPQYVLVKAPTLNEDWVILDSMRGISTGGNDANLETNYSSTESSTERITLTPTGFKVTTSSSNFNQNNIPYMYMAIRRGPLAAPTDATKVFNLDNYSSAGNTNLVDLGFDGDMKISSQGAGTSQDSYRYLAARLLSHHRYLNVAETTAEASAGNSVDFFGKRSNFLDLATSFWGNTTDVFNYAWKRAPSYFDVVTYVGDAQTNQNISHNLGVAPEMLWIKNRGDSTNWNVYHSGLTSGKQVRLNSDLAEFNMGSNWGNQTFNSSVFTVGSSYDETNKSSNNYVAFLFATAAGVSKVGSWTMASGNNNIDCGFTNGARFVLIKDVSATGHWLVWDSVKGIVSGNDPYFELDTDVAPYTTYDYIDPLSSGFTITSTYANFYAGNKYIFYAIA